MNKQGTVTTCAACGQKGRKIARGKWRHMRPQADGSPHDHRFQPTK